MIGVTPDITAVAVVGHGVLRLMFADGLTGEVAVLERMRGPVFEEALKPDDSPGCGSTPRPGPSSGLAAPTSPPTRCTNVSGPGRGRIRTSQPEAPPSPGFRLLCGKNGKVRRSLGCGRVRSTGRRPSKQAVGANARERERTSLALAMQKVVGSSPIIRLYTLQNDIFGCLSGQQMIFCAR